MDMRRISAGLIGLCLGLLGLSPSSSAQLATYTNLQNQVIVWDKGMIRKIDYLPPLQIKTGRTAIPYLDNARNFKIYYKGGVTKLNVGFTNEFHVSDHLVAFRNASSLNVFDDGEVTNLSTMASQFYLGDSLILFLDDIRSEYKAYYGGSIYPIEGFLAGNALNMVKVSDNIAAYMNYANQFRIFYQGQILAQEDYEVVNFAVGRNTVAYVDVNRQFKLFHRGQTYILEDFPPSSYQVGDNMVAYVSNDGYFKVFYAENLETIGFFTPEYRVVDHVLAYKDASGYFKVFYQGETHSLESYFPEKLVLGYHSLAYVNQANVLRLFTEGQVYDVTNADLEHWELNYDVIKYQIGRNIFRIYYKGREY